MMEVDKSPGGFLLILSFKRKHKTKTVNTLDCPPPSNSHHRDYYIFRIGDPNLNLHLPQAWEGGQANEYWIHRVTRDIKVSETLRHNDTTVPSAAFKHYFGQPYFQRTVWVGWFGILGTLSNNPFHKGILGMQTTGPQTTN